MVEILEKAALHVSFHVSLYRWLMTNSQLTSLLFIFDRMTIHITGHVKTDEIQLAKFNKSRNAADGKRTISFYIIKTSYNQAFSTEMIALKSNNAMNLCKIVNIIWNDRIRYEMAFLR